MANDPWKTLIPRTPAVGNHPTTGEPTFTWGLGYGSTGLYGHSPASRLPTYLWYRLRDGSIPGFARNRDGTYRRRDQVDQLGDHYAYFWRNYQSLADALADLNQAEVAHAADSRTVDEFQDPILLAEFQTRHGLPAAFVSPARQAYDQLARLVGNLLLSLQNHPIDLASDTSRAYLALVAATYERLHPTLARSTGLWTSEMETSRDEKID